MKNVFDAIASRYIRDDPHWGCDLDVLKLAFESSRASRRPVRYLDIGCGTGFHLGEMKRLYPDACAVGIDFSTGMLREARKHLTGLKVQVPLTEDDILTYEGLRRYYDVVSFLNNGLGNLYRNDEEASTSRVEVVSKMRKLLRRGGRAVVSVYNLKKLVPEYGPKFHALEKSDLKHGDLFVEYRPPRGRPVEYYSHWFMPDDIAHLFERDGFKIELLEERMARIVVRARVV